MVVAKRQGRAARCGKKKKNKKIRKGDALENRAEEGQRKV